MACCLQPAAGQEEAGRVRLCHAQAAPSAPTNAASMRRRQEAGGCQESGGSGVASGNGAMKV